MIFLTIGTQLPFDRLVSSVDSIASQVEEEIFGQIGHGTYTPKNFHYSKIMSPDDFNKCFANARVVIAHAGIGTILSGFKAQKPLIIMPRKANLGEHRNNHQLATVKQVSKFPGVYVAENSCDIIKLVKSNSLEPMVTEISTSRINLIQNLTRVIDCL